MVFLFKKDWIFLTEYHILRAVLGAVGAKGLKEEFRNEIPIRFYIIIINNICSIFL